MNIFHRTKRSEKLRRLLCGLLLLSLLCGCTESPSNDFSLANIPEYSGNAYIAVSGNQPHFTESDFASEAFEDYSELDSLGRCGIAFALLGTETMPTEERGYIGSVRPSGWQLRKYDFIEGKYLYNRCHLIGFQLAGENSNEKNLITGTRYLNISGMLPFENQVADYIKQTDNHVLYRVTPHFRADELLAYGVQIEAASFEDYGEELSFNVFCYNVQPGVSIDYADGESRAASETEDTAAQPSVTDGTEYVLNRGTMKFHYPTCASVKDITPKHRTLYTGSRAELLNLGYEPCLRCNP